MIVKNFNHTLERLDLFYDGKNYPEEDKIALIHRLYDAEFEIKNLKILRNTDRVSVNEILKRQDEFQEDFQIRGQFGPSWTTHWVRIELNLPSEIKTLKNYEEQEIHFIWKSESEVSIYNMEGKLIQAFSDEKRDIYVLKKPGFKDDFSKSDKIDFLLELACNGSFGNYCGQNAISGNYKEKVYTLKKASIKILNRPIFQMFYDFELLKEGAKLFEREQTSRAHQCLFTANEVVNKCLNKSTNSQSFKEGAELLQNFIKKSKNGESQHQVYAVGHCHIDTAWLWPYAETKRKVARSWGTQLELMDLYPDYKFCASSACQYYWLKQNYPELYQRLKQKIKEKKFEVVGGTWVEFDGNIPSGESMVRQFLYGQKFFLEEFGQKAQVFFMPDTFGYSPQLPQFMKESDINYFVTQKLSWSAHNKFSHSSFIFQGIDGSKVLSHFPPADTYNVQNSVKEIMMSQSNFKDKGRSNCSLILFGHGDGGGGPEFQHLERLKRTEDFDPLPKVKHATVLEFFENLQKDEKNLMCWKGELYLELHNGTYTTVSEVKKYNRKAEILLRDTEMLVVILNLINGKKNYLQSEKLTNLWRTLMTDQFHDVLPGTSIDLVYEDIRKNKDLIWNKSHELIQESFNISPVKIIEIGMSGWKDGKIQDQEIILFNSTNFTRKFFLNEKKSDYLEIQPFTLKKFFKSDEIKQSKKCLKFKEFEKHFEIENNYQKMCISKEGRILSWIDLREKNLQRELVKDKQRGINILTIHDDVPLFWDAWDIMLYDFETKYELLAEKYELLSQTEYLIELKYFYKISDKSWAEQIIEISSELEQVRLRHKIEWHESRKLLKIYFPVDINADMGNFDIQNGFIQRNTHSNTPFDSAKYEVYTHKYVDLSEGGFGFTVFNDCKYGVSVRDCDIGMTLLKSSKQPYSQADMGQHLFNLAIATHSSPFVDSDHIFQIAYQENYPIYAFQNSSDPFFQLFQSNTLSFIQIDQQNVILDCIKFLENSVQIQQFIVRIHEERGKTSPVNIKINTDILNIIKVQETNILEEVKQNKSNLQLDNVNNLITLKIKGFSLITLLISFQLK